MFLAPVLKEYFYGNATSYIGEMVIIAFSAQLFCLPITIYSFVSFSIIGILSNIIVTPIIPAIMALTFLIGIAPGFAPVALICKIMLAFQIAAIDVLSKANCATVAIVSGSPLILMMYIPIVLLMLFLKSRTKYSFRPRYVLDKIPEYGKIYTC